MLSSSHFSHISPLFQSVDYREEDFLLDRGLAQHSGGVDQGPAEHTQSPGQQPRYRGNHRQAHRERLADKGKGMIYDIIPVAFIYNY